MRRAIAVSLLAAATLLGARAETFATPARPGAIAATFRVSVPPSTPAGATVYVAGDFQGWNPGDPNHALVLQPDGRWTITLSFAPEQRIQFKFTRGSWARVEKGPRCEELPNRVLTPQDGVTYDFAVASWADIGTVTGRVEPFVHAPFLGGRRCWVYLPPGYETSAARYPVLYMHDGQNLFNDCTSFAGEWRVDETCEALIAAGEIEPIIVVGIENGPARCVEYTPWPDPSVPCGGGGADAYLAAVRDVLIPEVDRRYRTHGGAANTYTAGSSLGGLLAAYAGYAWDSTFGRVAAVSPYYRWADHAMFAFARGRPRPALARFYQDMGTNEFGFTDANGNGVDDFIDDLRTMRDIALAQGFVEGLDFLSVEGLGHTHNERYWALRLPDLLRFLIDRPGTAAAPSGGGAPARLGIAPNPVAGRARLEYSLPGPGPARIEVLDLHGRRVRVLADGPFVAGSGAVEWDVRDADGTPVPAGLYWARITTAGGAVVRRLSVVR